VQSTAAQPDFGDSDPSTPTLANGAPALAGDKIHRPAFGCCKIVAVPYGFSRAVKAK